MDCAMRMAAGAAMTCLIAGCADWMLLPDDRKLLCRVAVEERFGTPEFKPNPLSNPGGALVGAGGGALEGALMGAVQGALLGAGVGAIVLAPLGAMEGAKCAAAAAAHPTANADFQRILGAADAGRLKRSLEAALNAPRAECPSAGASPPADAAPPDAVVTIDKLWVSMPCLTGKQAYGIVASWHTAAARTGRRLNEGSAGCAITSSRSVDDWFAYPDRAREEIERALEKTGRHVAVQLLAESGYTTCALGPREIDEAAGGP